VNQDAARTVNLSVPMALGILASLAAAATTFGCHDATTPATLTVTAVNPDSGPVVGGTTVTITGVSFIDVTHVTIGGTELADRIVVGTTQITGTTPAGPVFGTTDVVVTSSSQGSGRCSGCFSYEPLDIVAQPLAAGTYHTCALNRNGAAYCWGQNTAGQLGDGSTASSSTPVAVSSGLTFGVLAAGGLETVAIGHTCGLASHGAAYCWGSNGNLGSGSTAASSTPVAVSGGLSFSVLVAFEVQTCGLTSAGAAFCWGDPENDNSFASEPYAVAGGLRFSALAAGGTHDCGLSPGGTAYCWGYNESGQLGVGTTTGPSMCRNGACSPDPVPMVTGLRWASITAGGAHTCGLIPAGEAYCWGSNSYGQLGVGSLTGPETCHVRYDFPCSSVPVPVATTLRWASITGGVGRTCGLTTGGEAYCWGLNSDGQLGNGSTANSAVPVAVSGGLTFGALALGAFHTCGRTTTDEVYCWGANGSGQLGDGTTISTSMPVKVSLPP
jgi:alpha-tubulin suppressor-like RCC1 family protein